MDEQIMSVPVAAMTAQPSGIVGGIDPKLTAASNHKLDPANNYMYNNNTNTPSTASVDGSYQFYYQQQQQQQQQHRYYSAPPNAGQYQQQMMTHGQFNQFNVTGQQVVQPGMNGQMSHYPNYYYQQAQAPSSNYYNNVNSAAYTPQPPHQMQPQHPSGVSMMQAPMAHVSNVAMMQGGTGQQQVAPSSMNMMGQPQQMTNAGYYAPNSMGVNNMKQPNGPAFSLSQTVSSNSTPANNSTPGNSVANGQSPTTSPTKKGRKPSGLSKAEKSKAKRDATAAGGGTSTLTNGISSSSSDNDSRLSNASSPHLDGLIGADQNNHKQLESVKEEKSSTKSPSKTSKSQSKKPLKDSSTSSSSPSKGKKNQTVANNRKSKSGEENNSSEAGPSLVTSDLTLSMNNHDSNHSYENSTTSSTSSSGTATNNSGKDVLTDSTTPTISHNEDDSSPTKKARKIPTTPRQYKRKNSQVSITSNDTNDSNQTRETAEVAPFATKEVAKDAENASTATEPTQQPTESTSCSADTSIYQQSQMLPPSSPTNGSSSSSTYSSSSLTCMNNASLNLNLAKSTAASTTNTNVPSPSSTSSSSSYSAQSPVSSSSSSSMNSTSANSNVSSNNQAATGASMINSNPAQPSSAKLEITTNIQDSQAPETSSTSVALGSDIESKDAPSTLVQPPTENSSEPDKPKLATKTVSSSSSIVPSLLNSSSMSADNSNMSFINDHDHDVDGEDTSMTSCDDPLSPKLTSRISLSSSKSHNVDVLAKLVEMGGSCEDPSLTEKRKDFAARLRTIWEEYTIQVRSVPNISKVPLDLFRVYTVVREKGGFNEVTKAKIWRDISTVLNVGSSASAAFNVRKKYISLGILHYECRHDLNGIDPQPIIDEVERATNPKQKSKMNRSESGEQSSQPSTPTKMAPSIQHQLSSGSTPASSVKKKKSSTKDVKAPESNENPSKSNTPTPSANAAQPVAGQMQQVHGQMMPPPPAPLAHGNMIIGPYGQHPMPNDYSTAATQHTSSSQIYGMQQQQQTPQNQQMLQYSQQQVAGYYNQRPYGPAGAYQITPGSTSQQPYNNSIPTQNAMYQPQPQQIQRVYNPAAAPAASASIPNGTDNMMYQQQQQYNQQMRYPMPHQQPQPTSQINQIPGPMVPQQQQHQPVQSPAQQQPTNTQMYASQIPNSAAAAAQPTGAVNAQQQQQYPTMPGQMMPGQHAIGHQSLTVQPQSYLANTSHSSAQAQQSSQMNGYMHAAHVTSTTNATSAAQPAQRSSSTDDIAQLINSVASKHSTSHRHSHGHHHKASHHAQSLAPTQQAHLQQQQPVLAVKKEIVFPTGSVEAILPVERKKRKINAKNIGPCDPWRLFMSLKSGLLAESTWALDALNILLYDDSSVAYFHLSHFPGLINILLEHFLKCLKLIFNGDNNNKDQGEFAQMNINDYANEFGDRDDFAELYASLLSDDDEADDSGSDAHSDNVESAEEEAQSVIVKRPRGRPPKKSTAKKSGSTKSKTELTPEEADDEEMEEPVGDSSQKTATKRIGKQINGYHKELSKIGAVVACSTRTSVRRTVSKSSSVNASIQELKTRALEEPKDDVNKEPKTKIQSKARRLLKDDCYQVLRIGFNHDESKRRFLSPSKGTTFNDSNVCCYWNKFNRKILAKYKTLRAKKETSELTKRVNKSQHGMIEDEDCENGAMTQDAAVIEADEQQENDKNLDRKLIYDKNRQELTSYLYSCFNSGDDLTALKRLYYGDYYDQRCHMERSSNSSIKTNDRETSSKIKKQKTGAKNEEKPSASQEFINRHRSWAHDVSGKEKSAGLYYDDQTSSTAGDEEGVFRLANQRENDLISRCTSISTILRNLSFVPGNDIELCKYPLLLEILARLLVLKHSHQIVICKSKIDLESIKKAKTPNKDKEDSLGGEHKHMNGHSNADVSDEMEEVEDISDFDFDESELDEQYNRCVKTLMGKGLFYRDENQTIKNSDGAARNSRSSKQENDLPTSTVENEWLLECVELLRENTLVTIANIASALNLNSLDERVIELFSHGLLHWTICQSQEARDPFPSMHDTNMLTPQRLAIEALSKMTINETNVDLLLATITSMRPYLDALIQTLCMDLLCRRDDETLREFAIVLLTALAKGDQFAANSISKYSSYLISFIEDFEEQAKRNAMMNPSPLNHQHHIHPPGHPSHPHHQHHHQHHSNNGGNFSSSANNSNYGLETVSNLNEEALSTTVEMLRRCANCLSHLAVYRDNVPLIMKHENRLLDLITSQFVDFEVAQRLSEILFTCSSHSLSAFH